MTTAVIIEAPPCALRSYLVSVPPAVQFGQLRRSPIEQVQKHGFGRISDLAGRLFRESSGRTLRPVVASRGPLSCANLALRQI